MEKEFVPYEQALALKELGFDGDCCQAYHIDGENELSAFYSNPPVVDEWLKKLPFIKAPLWQQAFRWFRKKHKLQAEILWRGDMECFCYKTGKFKYGSHDFSKEDFKTYEKAELECLKKLIEIIKKK